MVLKYFNCKYKSLIKSFQTYNVLSFSVVNSLGLCRAPFEQLFAILSHVGIGVTARNSAVDGGTGGGHLRKLSHQIKNS